MSRVSIISSLSQILISCENFDTSLCLNKCHPVGISRVREFLSLLGFDVIFMVLQNIKRWIQIKNI